jgi:hypothetical protein
VLAPTPRRAPKTLILIDTVESLPPELQGTLQTTADAFAKSAVASDGLERRRRGKGEEGLSWGTLSQWARVIWPAAPL